MVTLQNDKIKIGVKKTGAELCEISSIKNNTQFMWNAKPDIWGNYAPNLFPIIGMLKEECYFFEGKTYYLPKHGFVRNNTHIQLVEETNSNVTFMLTFDEESLKIYPFKFEYYTIYQLIENKLLITYKVVNRDTKPIYFSVGGHPAFKCPIYDYENYSDYQLIFDAEETSETCLLNLKSGLVTSETKPVFDTPKSINLHYDLFNDDALIFKDLKSRKVTLHSKNKGNILTVHYEGFPYLGVWAKPNAEYVCIEPWLGIADHEDANMQFEDKEGIIKLDVNAEFMATYTIEIHKSHLL
jgi:galactose mutarotase-like enzyme